MNRASGQQADVVLVGGGLANSLIALRLRVVRPELRVILLERGAGDGAAHTWSFFDTDLTAASRDWARALATVRWPDYGVAFPRRTRRLSTGYNSLAEPDLRRTVQAALGDGFVHGADVIETSPDHAVLADGRAYEAPLVIDGRGARPSRHINLAWQKFVEVRLQAPHGRDRPMLMDAEVAQLDGFRFVYVLPLAPDVLLVEDTRYSASATLDAPELRTQIADYLARHGWVVAETLRQEQGVLPLALGGDIEQFWAEQDNGVPSVGMRAALFHPTTGYSFPDAVATAEAVAHAPALRSAEIAALMRARSVRLWRERGFFRALNRMMFLAAQPEHRYRIIERFYGLPQPLIERFYAARLTWVDLLRLLVGEPPVPIGRALRALPPSALRGATVHA